MPTKNLTDLAIKRLKYSGKTTTYWDTNLKGFGIRVGKRTKTFIVMVGKDRKVITVRRYSDEDKLKDIRTEAKRLMLQETGKPNLTIDDAKAEFYDSCKKRLKPATVQQYKSYLDCIDLDLSNLSKPDIKDDTITFHTKGDRINILPLTRLVKQNLVDIPFQFNNWSTAKQRFDTDCGVDFRLHDLRRTLATKLASMGVSVITVERILGHSFGGVKAIYNRYSYLPEMKEALLIYEEQIHKLALLRA
jgi:integrase